MLVSYKVVSVYVCKGEIINVVEKECLAFELFRGDDSKEGKCETWKMVQL